MLILFSLMQSSKSYWGWWGGGRRKRRMKLLFISRCFFTSQTSSCKGNLVPRQTDCLGGCAYQGHWGIHTFRQKQWLFFTLSNYFLRKRECGRWRRLSEKTSCWPQHLGLGDKGGPSELSPFLRMPLPWRHTSYSWQALSDIFRLFACLLSYVPLSFLKSASSRIAEFIMKGVKCGGEGWKGNNYTTF